MEFEMKTFFAILILSASVASAEPLNLRPDSFVCGTVRKMITEYSVMSPNPILEIEVDGKVQSWSFPADPNDMSLFSTAFLSGKKFCAKLKTALGLLVYTYSLEEPVSQ
jgi:hypothetical protein